LKRLGLDRLVWLVSPQNPLKPATTGSVAQRMASVRLQARSPAMVVSDLETRIKATYSIETIRALQARYPGVRFVWIMGADSLKGLHRWRDWTLVMRSMPIAVVARPGSLAKARLALAPRRYGWARVPTAAARLVPHMLPPAWVELPMRLNPLSSSEVRSRRSGSAGR
jgi:nicotinate-nucleotide adenylyltransferase